MTGKIKQLNKLMQCHKGIEKFNYDMSVDWAIELLKNKNESENIYMLASFSKPVDSLEIRPYVSRVLANLNLVEKTEIDAVLGKAEYHLSEIMNNHAIRKNLFELYQLYIEYDYDQELMDFYLLHLAWNELEEIGHNFYYQGVDLQNIKQILKEKAENGLRITIRAENTKSQ